jgi:hypothetical protein
MFIHVAKDFAVTLEEPADFKHFKLVVDVPPGDAKLAPALDGIATVDREGHGWVSEAWLRGRDGAAAWQDGLTAMIGVAKKYGWVDDGKKAIRAHIEWPGQAAKS